MKLNRTVKSGSPYLNSFLTVKSPRTILRSISLPSVGTCTIIWLIFLNLPDNLMQHFYTLYINLIGSSLVEYFFNFPASNIVLLLTVAILVCEVSNQGILALGTHFTSLSSWKFYLETYSVVILGCLLQRWRDTVLMASAIFPQPFQLTQLPSEVSLETASYHCLELVLVSPGI